MPTFSSLVRDTCVRCLLKLDADCKAVTKAVIAQAVIAGIGVKQGTEIPKGAGKAQVRSEFFAPCLKIAPGEQ
jgi:hypothetical protein